MKRCPYCGKEYPDDAVRCFTDDYALSEIVIEAPSANPQTTATSKPLNPDDSSPGAKPEPWDLAYPDYKWSARDGWKCVGMFIVIGFAWSAVTYGLETHSEVFHKWKRSGLGYLCQDLVHYTLTLLIAAYFARTENLPDFFRAFGLDRKPSDRVWFGILMALAIRGLGQFVLIQCWSKGVSNYDLSAYRATTGAQRYIFLMPSVFLAPVFEETIYRGFLFKAFRSSYPFWASVALIVAWTANTHWRQYSVSWIAAIDLSLLTILQCYLREKSDTIWDCVLCHFAFNASRLLVGHTLS